MHHIAPKFTHLLGFNLNSAETCDEMQKIAQEVSPLLTAFSNDISLNENLFQRVKAIYDKKDTLNLTPEQATLLDKKYKSFARNGALLTEDKKSRLREIDTELAKLKLTFGENVLAETNNYQLHITNEADLKGLPEGAIEMARALAESKNVEGWIFTLDFPSYLPFVTYADNRELRKEITIAAGKKAFQNNEYNNEKITTKQLALMNNDGESFTITATEDSMLFVGSGETINEPIAAHGPFVMNTQAEIMQAFHDVNMGKFGYLEE